MGAAAPAVGAGDGDAGAEIDLGFRAGDTLQAAERQFRGGAQPAHEAADAVVLAGKAVLADQVLVDALGGESRLQLGHDDRPERLTPTRLERRLAGRGSLVGAERRPGLFWRFRRARRRLRRAERRPGLFCPPQLPGDGVPVDAQASGNAPDRPAPLV